MEIAYLGYLVFVIPGFCLVWTYRHFTKADRIGDFEYAAWSFLYGTVMFLIVVNIGGEEVDFVMDLNNPLELFAKSTGAGIGTALAASFPLGYAAAFGSRLGLFEYIDRKLFQGIEKYCEWVSKAEK